MQTLIAVLIVVGVLVLIGLVMALRLVWQYEEGVLFRLGRLRGTRAPGLRVIIPIIDQLRKVSLRIVTMPIQSQGIITRDNVSVDVCKILDDTTAAWGVEVTLVELKDIQLPETMKRAMAKQAEAEREKRAKIINAEGESLAAAALGQASDTMMAHPLALQLRNLQSLVEIGVDKNTTVVFPAPLMSTIEELGEFLHREGASASSWDPRLEPAVPTANGATGPVTAVATMPVSLPAPVDKDGDAS
jgi:regulator of protease activity HflC (stomatin/prohibitin superfamily)